MTSTMAKMITERQRNASYATLVHAFVCVSVYACVALTEGQPGLPDLQVDGEVGLQAQVSDSDVGARLPTQAGVLHVAVEDPCVEYWKMIQLKSVPFRL